MLGGCRDSGLQCTLSYCLTLKAKFGEGSGTLARKKKEGGRGMPACISRDTDLKFYVQID